MDDLHTAWQRLAWHWEESEKDWNDPVRREFEKRYWQPLSQETQSTAREIERLVQVLDQVRRSLQ